MGTVYIAVNHEDRKIVECGKSFTFVYELKDWLEENPGMAPSEAIRRLLRDEFADHALFQMSARDRRAAQAALDHGCFVTYSEHDAEYEDHEDGPLADYTIVASAYDDQSDVGKTWRQYWKDLL